MDTAEVLDRLRLAGLGHRVGEIAPLLLPAVRLALHLSDDQRVPLGTSKIGGLCDLPAGIPWPAWRGESLTALAQFNLAEVARVAGETPLPASGMLYFFYERRLEKWMAYPDESDGHRVVYYAGDVSALARRAPPAPSAPDVGTDQPPALRPHHVTFTTAATMPPPDSPDVERLGLDAAEQRRYETVEREVNAFGHQLLGHPKEVQFDMQRERAVVARGLTWPAFSTLPEDEQAAILSEARPWRLLYQVEEITEEGPFGDRGSTWGDAGQLYYWIRADALDARDFSRTPAVEQSC
jgi:uncharacterized protein YwqG